jgi:hypothetical protein
MEIRKLIGATMVVALVGLSTTAAADDDRCKSVRFKFTNNHATESGIVVTGVEYEDVVNNKTVVRKLQDVKCAYRATCVTGAEDLRDIEGNKLKNVRLVYKYRERDGDMSDKKRTDAFTPTHLECRADRIYGPGERGFVIGPGNQ